MSAVPQNSPAPSYHRLPGRAKRLFGFFVNEKQRIHMGDDHILLTTTSYNYERYKRFYLADVQSITVQKSSAGAVLNVILGGFAGLFGAIALAAYAAQWDVGVQIVMVVIAGIFLGITLINTAIGPTCQCHILTAVHEEPLYCLGRLYTAQRVVEYLRTVIEGVQGATGDMSGATTAASQRIERAADRREMTSIKRLDNGRLHLVLFVALIVEALVGGAGIYFRSSLPITAYLVPSLVALCIALAAAIRQRDTDIPPSVRTVVWVALGVNGVVAALLFYASVFEQAFGQGIDAQTEQVAGALRVGFAFVGNAFSAPANFVVGALGLRSMQIWRRAVAARAAQQRIAAEEGAQP